MSFSHLAVLSRVPGPHVALFRRMRLRAKLTLAFLCLSTLIGVCGASGLVFVNGIGATLSVFADVTSPLLGQTVGLVDNAQRMRTVYLDAINSERIGEDSGQALAELDLAAGKAMEMLRRLFDEAKLPMKLADIEHRQQEFAQGLHTMLSMHTRVRITALTVKDQLTQFDLQRRDFDALLRTTAARAEGLMSQTRDEAGLQISAGTATVERLGDLFTNTLDETYPLVQSLYRLMRDVVTLQEVATSYINITRAEDLLAVERRAVLTFANANEVLDRLAGRLITSEGKDHVIRFKTGIEGLQAASTATDCLRCTTSIWRRKPT